jgi:aminopeptidase N
MKRTILLFLFGLMLSFSATSQEYASSENPYYWKNRKPNEAYWQQDVNYKIRVSLSDTNDVVWGSEQLIYTNNSPDNLGQLYFHLYQNAFIKGSYLENLNKENGFLQKFGRHEIAGRGTIIKSLKINGQAVKISLDNTILKVDLNEPLQSGKQLIVDIEFETYFDDGGEQRRRMKLFNDNFGNKHYDGVHWYPRICVYDRKFGWETDQHLGKEFYGDFGSFDVELKFPHHYILDATGVIQNKEEALSSELRAKLDIKNFVNKPWESEPSIIIEPDPSSKEFRTWKFKAVNVHDFAWTADPTYRIGETKLKLKNGHEVSIISLAQEPHAAGWQDASSFTAKVIETYSNDIGYYMYPKMIVADARDGMEYPMLTLDGGSSPGYYGLLAHEVGHNWFFGMVGNNETYRASLDEGFTQFLTHWSTSRLLGEYPKYKGRNHYVKKHYQPVNLRETTVYLGYMNDALADEDMQLNTHSDDFNSALGHGGGYRAVYYKTATMLYNLEYVLGDSLFLHCMQSYFNQWKNCHPYFEDFRASMIHFSKTDLNWFFDQWMETTKKVDYKIYRPKLINSGGNNQYNYLIKLRRIGEMQMPIDLYGETKEGKPFHYTIPNSYFIKNNAESTLPIWKGWGLLNKEYSTQIQIPGKLKWIAIDTTYRLADVNTLNNCSCFPLDIQFDHQIKNPIDRKHYILKWRPDLWWNNLDGIKAGLHFNGNYMQKKHQFKLTAWYNTDLGTNYANGIDFKSNNTLIDYNFWYKNLLSKNTYVWLQSRQLDGLNLQLAGLEWTPGNQNIKVFIKTMTRFRNGSNLYVHSLNSDLNNLLYINDNIWQTDRENTTINLEWRTAKDWGRRSRLFYEVGLRSSILSSFYQYNGISAKIKSEHNLGKIYLSTRLFGQWMEGNIAPESRLFLAGANPEEMMENKYARSTGFIQNDWSTIGTQTNHFQMGGGLNVRGFNGYLLPFENSDLTQSFVFSGNKGVSFSVELDYDGLFNINPKGIFKPFHLDAYLFADAGLLYTNSTPVNVINNSNTGFRSSAGPGFMLQIKKWGKLEEIKPLNIRIDLPIFLSNAPFSEENNIKFRWLIGINRSF